MFGPGAYRPDPTEGITAIADLPQAEIVLCYKRILYAVLDHDPHPRQHMQVFVRRLHLALSARALTLVGITTSWLSALSCALGGGCGRWMRVKICAFHVLADVVKAVLGAVTPAARTEKSATKQPQLPQGRPSPPAAKQAAGTKKRLAGQRAHHVVHLAVSVRPTATVSPLLRQFGAGNAYVRV